MSAADSLLGGCYSQLQIHGAEAVQAAAAKLISETFVESPGTGQVEIVPSMDAEILNTARADWIFSSLSCVCMVWLLCYRRLSSTPAVVPVEEADHSVFICAENQAQMLQI